MHIPDGFISLPTAAVTGLLSTAGVALALRRSRQAYGMKQAPILGLTTAFIFAAQMVNFPVAGGTSGHLLGGTLAAVLTGSPWSGLLCVTTVLIVQAVMFADGGLLAIGANVFNMAIVGVWTGWILTQTLQRLFGGGQHRLPWAAGTAAAVSVVAAAIACAIELISSGTAPAAVILPALTGVHVLIGLGEAMITSAVLTYLLRVRPDLLPGQQPRLRRWQVPIVSVCLIAGCLSLLASPWPDGLEKIASDLGFAGLADRVWLAWPTPLANYGLAGWGPIGTSIAGLCGSFVSFAAAFGLARWQGGRPGDRLKNP